MRKTRVLFDHVPKTAGTSIVTALSQALGEDGRLASYALPHHVAITSAGLRNFIAGHLWFAPGEHLARGWYYATVLRDPVDRFLSQYHFGRTLTPDAGHQEQHQDPQVAAARRYGIEEYLALEADVIRRSYWNIQAVHFAGRVCPDPCSLSEPELLDAAVSGLAGYDLTGTFDDLQGFIAVACRDLGREAVALPTLNVTLSRPRSGDEASHWVDRRLRDANRVDLQLVQHARERFRAAAAGEASRGHDAESYGTASGVEDSSGMGSFDPMVFDFGTREIEIVEASCTGRATPAGELLDVTILCDARISEPDLTLGIAILDPAGKLLYGTHSRLLGKKVSIGRPQRFQARYTLRANLGPGEYLVTLALHKGASHLEGCYHWLTNATRFIVAGGEGRAWANPVDLEARLSVDAAA